MNKTLRRVVVAVALAAACATLARSGSGHGSTSSGHAGPACAGHSAAQQGQHGGGVTPHVGVSTVHGFHGSGGAGYGASYAERNIAVDRELHERIVKTQRAKDAFRKLHPCPGNGSTAGNCPGYSIGCIDPDPAEPARCQDASHLEWRPVR